MRQAKARFVAGTVRDRRAQGRPPSDHLHAVRSGSPSSECQGAGGRPSVRALRPRPARPRFSQSERRTSDKRVEFQALYQRAGRRRSAQSPHLRRRHRVGAATAGRRWCSPSGTIISTASSEVWPASVRHLVVLARRGWARSSGRPSLIDWRPSLARGAAGHSGDRQVHWRRIRRSAPGHVVPDAAGLVARNHRAVRRPAAPPLRRQARGARLRLRGPQRADAGADVRPALPRL